MQIISIALLAAITMAALFALAPRCPAYPEHATAAQVIAYYDAHSSPAIISSHYVNLGGCQPTMPEKIARVAGTLVTTIKP